MSVAVNNRVAALEEKVKALEAAVYILLREQKPDGGELEKIKNDIQGIKMRMGRIKEVAA